jgi:phosphoserine phosphatase
VAVPYESYPIPGLEVFDPVTFEAKMRRFGAAGLDSVHGVFDFDLTLTMPNEDGHPISSWGILKPHLPAEAQRKSDELFAHYYPLERGGTMTFEDAESWWTQALIIQRDSRVNLAEVEAHFLEVSSIRPGTKELFDYMKSVDVPSVVLSAGVKNVIDMWCAAYDIAPDLVISTLFETDEQGRMTGWDESSVVHVMNKAETGHPELERIKLGKPHVILVGDNIHDADMASGDDNVIRIRIIDTSRDTPAELEAIRQVTSERFDAIIEDGDMHAVRAVMDRIDAYSDAS